MRAWVGVMGGAAITGGLAVQAMAEQTDAHHAGEEPRAELLRALKDAAADAP